MNSWHAYLKLILKSHEGKTFIYKKKHKGPILVQKAFYPEKKNCHIYILHPPGSIISGDYLNIYVKLKEKSQALITNPSANKFYPYNGKISLVKQNFYLEENSFLEYLPQINIFFKNAFVNIENNFFLNNNTKLFIWDNLCFIGKDKNKIFGNGSIISKNQIFKNNIPILNEKIRIIQGDLSILPNKYYWVSTIFIVPGNKKLLNLICKLNYKNSILGATLINNLIIVRMLNNSNIKMHTINLKIWHLSRKSIIQKKIHIPRIWNT